MTFVLEPYQKIISARALSLFRYYWFNPYMFKSDREWVCEFKNDAAVPVSFGTCCKFFCDYGLWKGMKWRRPDHPQDERPDHIFMRVLRCEALSDKPDPYQLASKWLEEKALSNRQISAASKLLFFMRPDVMLSIYDSCAREAVRCRVKSMTKNLNVKMISVNFTKNSQSFSDFMAHASKVVEQNKSTWTQGIPSIVGTDSGSDESFLLRRVADKHLFLEGEILASIKETKNLQKSLNKIISKHDVQLGKEGALGTDPEVLL